MKPNSASPRFAVVEPAQDRPLVRGEMRSDLLPVLAGERNSGSAPRRLAAGHVELREYHGMVPDYSERLARVRTLRSCPASVAA